MILFRPVGIEELILIFGSGMRAFPPRLPDQPIFYPVVNEEYATQIARDWNTRSGSIAGYVTRFLIEDAYVTSFPLRTVGARQHKEVWVPAENLSEFNARIDGQIQVIGAFFGEGFRGVIPTEFALKGKDAAAQIVALNGIYGYNLMDF